MHGLFVAGETEENHRELVDFCQQFQFERMGCFTYSEEDGTPAASYPEQASTSCMARAELLHAERSSLHTHSGMCHCDGGDNFKPWSSCHLLCASVVCIVLSGHVCGLTMFSGLPLAAGARGGAAGKT